MSEIEMKSGVKVKCVDATGVQTIKKDEFYTVRSVAGAVLFLMEKGDIGYAVKRFKATEEAAPVMETDFGAGDIYMLEVVSNDKQLQAVFTDIPDVNIGALVITANRSTILASSQHEYDICRVVNILPMPENAAANNIKHWVVDLVDEDMHNARAERFRRKQELIVKRRQLEIKAEQLIQEEMRRKNLQDILCNSEAGKVLLAELETLAKEIEGL